MDQDRLPRRLLHCRPESVGGKQKQGRARVCWMDVVKRDAAAAGIMRDLEEAAADRVGWRRMLALTMS